MTAFAVDLGELEAAIARLDAARATLAERVGDLDTAIRAAQQDWTGAAATAHEASRQQLMTGIAELQTALAGLRAVAKHAHAVYSEATRANSSTWQQLG